MFRPNLKRGKQASSTLKTADTERKANAQKTAKGQQSVLVPSVFFEKCKDQFFQNEKTLSGCLNTYECAYPKQVQQKITEDQYGFVYLNEEIFSFYKDKILYFWTYQNKNLSMSCTLLQEVFEEPITCIDYCSINYEEFQSESFTLVLIAFGAKVRLYKLSNTSISSNRALELSNLMIMIFNNDIVTRVKIIYKKNENADSLMFLFTDCNGKPTLFDFAKKKKHFSDTIKQKIIRYSKAQIMSEVRSVVLFQQHLFCLVDKYYKPASLFKKLQRLLRSREASHHVKQVIEIYKIEMKRGKGNSYRTYFPIGVLESVKKHKEISVRDLVKRLSNSFQIYFQEHQLPSERIQSIIGFQNAVEVMFDTGETVMIDSDGSFMGPPKPPSYKPENFGLMRYSHSQLSQQTLILKKAYGSRLAVFDEFIYSEQGSITYWTPYRATSTIKFIRSIQVYRNKGWFSPENDNQFALLGYNSFTLVQKITPKQSIFLYCLSMTDHDEIISPKQNIFADRISKLIEIFNPTQIIYWCLELIKSAKVNQNFSMLLRNDIFSLVCQQTSSNKVITFEQNFSNYEMNSRSLIKNRVCVMTPEIEQLIWKILFKIDGVKVLFPLRAQNVNPKKIEAICLAFQIVISENLSQIKNWTAKQFSNNRSQVYRIIAECNSLMDLLSVYIKKETESENRRNIELQEILNNRYSHELVISNKTKFCQMSKMCLQKVAILLNVYDYVCQLDRKSNINIPKFSQLLLNFNHNFQINFANTIIKILVVNNQVLLDELDSKIPELKIAAVRKFEAWKKFHLTKSGKNEEIDETLDNQFNAQVLELSELLSAYCYHDFEDFYLNRKSSSKSQITTNFIKLLRGCMMKVSALKDKEVYTYTRINNYKKQPEDYFGSLQIEVLIGQCQSFIAERNFFIVKCQQLVKRLFAKLKEGAIGKLEIQVFLQSINQSMIREIRADINKELEKHHLQSLQDFNNPRQLFTNRNYRIQSPLNGDLFLNQLAQESIRR